MDFDDAYIGPYIEDWLNYIRESNNEEEKKIIESQEFFIPYTGIPMAVVKTIFSISDHFKLGLHAKYLSVHIFDKYMCASFRNMNSDETKVQEPWEQVSKKFASLAKLRVISCIQLASKMDLYSKGIGISQIVAVLQFLDPNYEYTCHSIKSSEIHVYKTLGYRIWLCTPMHCIEILLAIADLRNVPDIYDTCVHLLDLAYLQHEELFSRLHAMAVGKSFSKSDPGCRNFVALEANSLFLGAAVVLSSTFFLCVKKNLISNLPNRLADLVQIDAIDINMTANLLFTLAMDGESAKSCASTADSDGA